MRDFELGPKAKTAGYRLQSFETISSTNLVAMDAAKNGQAGNFWIVSDHQTAGKGRRGRQWQSAPGNLAASLMLILPKETEAPEMLGFVAGIALVRTVQSFIDDHAISIVLKWPNDLLLDNAKLAGILLESQILPNGQRAIIVGMGLNIVSAPQGVPYATTALGQFDPTATATKLFKRLCENWVDCFKLWDFGNGRAELLAQWRQLAAGAGQPIKVARLQDIIHGTFHSIDEQGRLIVSLASGQHETISAGDVYFEQ